MSCGIQHLFQVSPYNVRMYYYEVYVRSAQFHGTAALTYEYETVLKKGTIVSVPLRSKRVLGIVVRTATKPLFATKPILSHAKHLPKIPNHTLELIEWLQQYYPAPLGQIISLFLPDASMATLEKATTREHYTEPKTDLPPAFTVTDEQASAIKTIAASSTPVILHGDTATGKTRVYLELIRSQLLLNKSTILLTPEIGLTPQLVQEVEHYFPGRTIVLHSTQTPAERRNNWLSALQAKAPQIVIGPRSALFSPLPSIGLIVIDEAHDQAYKQEQSPHYIATRVAAALARSAGSKLVLGTATPSVVDYHTFKTKGLPIIRMQTQAVQLSHTVSPPEVVDLRDRQQFTRSAWLSNKLVDALTLSLKNGEQSLVFLNRRGSARLILCSACGWQYDCPRCDIPLTFHGDTHMMLCHSCGFTSQPPTTCQQCGATDILFKSIGTKAIVSELHRLFPDATIVRFDSDNTKTEKLESQYNALKNGTADIIVGTQVVSKGLDLPKLSLVGIVMADTALTFPDYSAEERSYQLITQVLGRSQRGHIDSVSIVQSYQPTHPALLAATTKDYASFYESQIVERQTYNFPPFCHLLKLTVHKSRSKSAQTAAVKLANELKASNLHIEVNGPSPSFIEKRGDQYYWQIVIKSSRRPELLRVLAMVPSQWQYDLDPLDLL